MFVLLCDFFPFPEPPLSKKFSEFSFHLRRATCGGAFFGAGCRRWPPTTSCGFVLQIASPCQGPIPPDSGEMSAKQKHRPRRQPRMWGRYFSLPFLRKGSRVAGATPLPGAGQSPAERSGNSGRGAKSVQWTFFAWGNPSEGFPRKPPRSRSTDRGGSREFPVCEAEAPTEAVAENSPSAKQKHRPRR